MRLHSGGLLRTLGDDFVLVLMSRLLWSWEQMAEMKWEEDPRDARSQLDCHPKINDG